MLMAATKIQIFLIFPLLPGIRFSSVMKAGNISMLCQALRLEIIDRHLRGSGWTSVGFNKVV